MPGSVHKHFHPHKENFLDFNIDTGSAVALSYFQEFANGVFLSTPNNGVSDQISCHNKSCTINIIL